MTVWQALFQPKMLSTLLMGFASGLPLLLTSRTLQAWMTEQGVDLKVIGLFALVGLPYTLKFLWSPVFDRFVPPFLGRRRGWLLICQLALAASIAAMALVQPKDSPALVAALCLLISFFSASQDIVVDAYRRETLTDNELGMGSTLYVYGYRVAMWVSGALALILADHISWHSVYLIMTGAVSVGIITTLCSKEPEMVGAPPKNFGESVIEPLLDFFRRTRAFEILLFILLYKVGDTMAGSMATPFYIKIGFTKTEIGTIAKTFGFFSAIAGGFAGGLIVYRMGINRSLWIFGVLQALSTACFAYLATMGPDRLILTGVIAFEDFSGALGTTAFVAYMAAQTNRRFTATQYALLSSLMGVPRIFLAAPTGYLVEGLGWINFFLFSAMIAIPGMLLLFRVAPWNSKESN